MAGSVYIVTNRRNGILYIAGTSDLPRRAHEHRLGLVAGFTKRYGLKRLVWYEPCDDIRTAIQREKKMKHWPLAWKLYLISILTGARRDTSAARCSGGRW